MTLQQYTEYKDTGVPWLGVVPAHWHMRKLKNIANFSGGGTPSREEPSYWGGDIPWVSPKDMKAEIVVSSEEMITVRGLENSTTSLISPGQVLMVVRSGILKHTIPVAINAVPVTLNQDMKAIGLIQDECLSEFFMRWVQGLNRSLLFAWAKQGATVESIEHAYLANTLILLPPVDEQRAIGDFIDHETAKIDTLIVEQQRLIELLKAKRQAIIASAVTKGLNPHAEMKDSDVPWLGTVPANWLVRPLKYLVRLESGGTPSKANPGYWDGDVPWASSKDLKVDEIEDTVDHITSLAVQEGGISLLPSKTVLVVVRGMILAHTFPVTQIGQPMAINQDLKGLRPISDLTDDYLAWVLRGFAQETLSRVDEAGHGTKVLRIEAWVSMEVPLPPITEQREISTFLVGETARIDALIAAVRRSIELSLERRSALISAAVTGKIDVRSHAAVPV